MTRNEYLISLLMESADALMLSMDESVKDSAKQAINKVKKTASNTKDKIVDTGRQIRLGYDYGQALNQKARANEAREKFKKDYDYNPKDKTINLNGKRRRVSFSNDDDAGKNHGMLNKKYPGTNLMNMGTAGSLIDKKGRIYIDDATLAAKLSRKEMDYVLGHENGHTKLHTGNSHSKQLDRELVNQHNIDRANTTNNLNQRMDQYDNTETGRGSQANLEKMKSYQEKYKNNSRNKARQDNIQKFQKYLKDGNQHLSTIEMEADVYGINNSDLKSMKGALKKLNREYQKTNARNLRTQVANADYMAKHYGDDSSKGLSPEKRKEMNNANKATLQKLKHDNKEDLKQRIKAAKDKSIDRSVYKTKNEAAAVILIEEAIALLTE